ncbi:hypothetical protein FACS189494_03420 [Spirochaetia bacterium]|nr:hypothetical protein FACS189494_03420 [Spirochaetia bacterium]
MKKIFSLVIVLFCVTAFEAFAQTINFEYEVSQKYPIYVVFEGDISAAWESTAWFADEESWHYKSNEWKWDSKKEEYYYAGEDQDNDDHWIIDKGLDFYIGPDDPNNSYAYLNNKKKDWEMFRMELSNQNVIYATGNVIFDRIDGTPTKENPYIGTWRAREDDSLAVTFNKGSRFTNPSCKIEVTKKYKNKLPVGKIPSEPVTKTEAVKTTPSPSPSEKSGSTSGGNDIRNKLVATIKSHLDKNYKYGTQGMQEFDCSGLLLATYKQVTGITIPRSSIDIYRDGKQIKANELKPGDVIVYATQGGTRPTHVGMYVGDNSFIHAWGPGGSAKVVLHPRNRLSNGTPMTSMEVGYRRFLND